MSLLSMAIVPEERSAFRQRFVNAIRGGSGECRKFLCFTPVSVIAKAFKCKPFQLRSAANMFPESGLQSEFLNEFYIMDVILNWTPSPAVSTGDGKGGRLEVAAGVRIVTTAMRFAMPCRAIRKTLALGWIISTGLRLCSYLSVGCSTVIGTVTLGMLACRAR